jgi:CAAX prenyl protease-like protein
MNALSARLNQSPVIARAAPFVVFVLLTAFQGSFGEVGRYWLYFAKTLLGAWLLWTVRHVVTEMRWNFSGGAVIAGVGVFALWIGLDGIIPTQQQLWAKLGLATASATPSPMWNPFQQFGDGSATGWFFVAVRVLGSSLVVPPLEEVFYRSFLYRWIARPDFQSVPLGQFAWKPMLLTAVIFGFAHNEWLAGIFCAAAYQCLVCWRRRLGDAMTAHAMTNFLLGGWVVWKNAWHFW